MLRLLLSPTVFNLLCTCLSCSKRLFLCLNLSSYLCSSFCLACLSVCVKIVLAEVLLVLLYYSILVHTISEMYHTSIDQKRI